MFDYTGFGAVPGIDSIRENIEQEITWGNWEYNKSFVVPTLLDGAGRDAGASPTTLLRPGLLMGQDRTTKKFLQWDETGAATDGSTDIAGVLLWDSITQQLGTNKDRWFGFVLVGGCVKASALTYAAAAQGYGIDGDALEHFIRGQMSGRFLFDDYYHQWSGGPLMGGWKNIVAKTSSYTVVDQDNGTLFTNLGASGAVTFTLPAITNSKGQRYGFYVAADQNVIVQSAASGDITCFNNAAADSVAFQTPSEKIGGFFEVIGHDNATWLVKPSLGNDSQTVTVA